jgi:hypothetical protein
MQIRQTTAELSVYTSDLKKRTIPANAILHDFRIGPGHEGLAPHNPDVASFHYEGRIYFNITHEIVGNTVIVSAGSSPLPDF